jgi:putative transposase
MGCGTSPSLSPPYVGQPVTIRYDPRDLAEIRVYHRDKFLCQAVSPDIASVTVSLQDLQAARNQRHRELRQQLTARRGLVELLTQPKPESARGETTRKTPTTADPVTTAGTRLKLYRED